MNFILSQQRVNLGLFEKPAASTMNQALVYMNPDGEAIVLRNGDNISKSEVKRGRFNTLYKVNMLTESFDFEKEYPTNDPVETVKVRFDISVKVADPLIIVNNQQSSIVDRLRKDLDFSVERLTKMYDPLHIDGLEEDITNLRYNDSLKVHSRGVEITEILAGVSFSQEKINRLKKRRHKEEERQDKLEDLHADSQEKKVTYEINEELMEHVVRIYKDKGYFGAKLVFKDEPYTLEVLDIVHQQFEENLQKMKANEEERRQTFREFLDRGMSVTEAEEATKKMYNIDKAIENDTIELEEGKSTKDQILHRIQDLEKQTEGQE